MRQGFYAFWGPVCVLAVGLLASVFRHDLLGPALGAFVVAIFAFRFLWVGLECGRWLRRRGVPGWAKEQGLEVVHRRFNWAALDRMLGVEAGTGWLLDGLPTDVGEDQYGLRLVNGRWRGRPVLAADYEYVVRPDESSPRRISHNLAVVAVRADHQLPELEAVPAYPLARAGRLLRRWRGRAAYTGLPGVDARYVVRPLRRQRAAVPGGVFDSGLDALSAHWLAEAPAVHWRSGGDTVVTWRVGYLSRRYLRHRLRFLGGLAERLPPARPEPTRHPPPGHS